MMRRSARSQYRLPAPASIIDIGGAGAVIDANPTIGTWAVGGHSLGGVSAATYASGNPQEAQGLVMWAAYPNNYISTVGGLEAVSVYGRLDGLTTPADIEANKPKMPPATTYIPLAGVVHSFFGDYGEQDGDGTPKVSKERGQSNIVRVTLDWLNEYSGVVQQRQ